MQLNQKQSILESSSSLLEISRRYEAKLHSDIKAQRTQQNALDTLALKLETDCLKAEDATQALLEQQYHINKEALSWSTIEQEQLELALTADKDTQVHTKHVRELYRMLNDLSEESEKSVHHANLEESASKIASQELKSAVTALHGMHERMIEIHQRLDGALLTVDSRENSLSEIQKEISLLSEKCKIFVCGILPEKKDALQSEHRVEQCLKDVKHEIVKEMRSLDQTSSEMQSSMTSLISQQKILHGEVSQLESGMSEAERRKESALLTAQYHALRASKALQLQKDLKMSFQTVQAHAQDASMHHQELSLLINKERSYVDESEKQLLLSEQQYAKQSNQLEASQHKLSELQASLQNVSSQEQSLSKKLQTAYEKNQQHEEALYGLKYTLIIAKQASENGTGLEHEDTVNIESLQKIKSALQSKLESMKKEHRDGERKLAQAHKEYADAEALLKCKEIEVDRSYKEVSALTSRLKHAEKCIKTLLKNRDELQVAFDRLSLQDRDARSRLLSTAATIEQEKMRLHTALGNVAINIEEAKKVFTTIKCDEMAAKKEMHNLKMQLKSEVSNRKRIEAQQHVHPVCFTGAGDDDDDDEEEKTLQQRVEELQCAIDSSQKEIIELQTALQQQKEGNTLLKKE